MAKYTIGYDFGTLSVRALLVNIETGDEVKNCEYLYPHGVMDQSLPNGTKFDVDWALQHPDDYMNGFIDTTKEILQSNAIDAEDIVGVGIDFTSCTILPVTRDAIPLCTMPEYQNNPHAYVKLWKHHAAQYCADLVNELAVKTNQPWLSLYGGKISSEWLIPKVLQIIKESPDVYDASDRIIEAGDWMVWKLCGNEVRSVCSAGYKALWHHEYGYPSKEFLRQLDPRLETLIENKLSQNIKPLGTKAGYITKEISDLTGLSTHTVVAVSVIDAHASVPACAIAEEGKMLMIIGTSTCHMLLSKQEKGVKGTCGIVKGGIIPNFFGYEAGQCCVGDQFSWFLKHCVPTEYYEECKDRNINIHQLLREKAEKLKVCESGLLALDWWNGVRSNLMDADLSGMILGLTLQTKPEEIYRALIESTAFGTRRIIETFLEQGVAVNELFAAGGIAAKDPMMMQIYADVCNKSIRISGSNQSGALGSAIFAAVAVGKERGGYEDIAKAAKKLGKLKDTSYHPIAENVRAYELLYQEYKILYDYFGNGQNNVMKNLKKYKRDRSSDPI